jgi:DNA-binding transcriptional regulator YdaS (Cro superfamily)
MTPEEKEQEKRRIRLRATCKSLGNGGQSKLARMLKWDSSMIRRRLSGETKIAYSDELAIAKAIEEHVAHEGREVK